MTNVLFRTSGAWSDKPMKTITLSKIGDNSKVYTYTYKSLLDHDALARASQALKRDMPGEDPLNWRLI